jgi:prevent-host-death family protein
MSNRKEPEIKTVTASEARQQLPQLLNNVHQGKTRIVVERSGISVAAIVTVEELRRLEQSDEKADQLRAVMERMSDAFKDVPPEELERQTTRAVTQARAQLRAERDDQQKRQEPSSPTP